VIARRTFNPRQPSAYRSLAVVGYTVASLLTSSGARYLVVPVCSLVVVMPVLSASRNTRASPKSQILGTPWSSTRTFPFNICY
jgi:hypothetical protein